MKFFAIAVIAIINSTTYGFEPPCVRAMKMALRLGNAIVGGLADAISEPGIDSSSSFTSQRHYTSDSPEQVRQTFSRIDPNETGDVPDWVDAQNDGRGNFSATMPGGRVEGSFDVEPGPHGGSYYQESGRAEAAIPGPFDEMMARYHEGAIDEEQLYEEQRRRR